MVRDGLGGEHPRTREELAADSRLISLTVKCGLCKSNGEARKTVQQGGITVNDEKITDVETVETNETAQTEDFGYWSKLLSQPFDTLAELVAAENARRAEDEAKAKAKETRKADAEVVDLNGIIIEE